MRYKAIKTSCKEQNITSYLYQLNRLGLGLGWVCTFIDCMFDTNNKKGVKCHLLHFEPFKIAVAYQTIHKFNSQ